MALQQWRLYQLKRNVFGIGTRRIFKWGEHDKNFLWRFSNDNSKFAKCRKCRMRNNCSAIVVIFWLFFMSVALCTDGRNVVLHQLKAVEIHVEHETLAVACSCCQQSLKNRNALWSVRGFQHTFFPADIILLAMPLPLRFPLRSPTRWTS